MLLALNVGFVRTFVINWPFFPPMAPYRPQPGQAIAITLSKNGAAFGNPSIGASNLVDMGNGFYSFALAAADCDTLGSLTYQLNWGGGGFIQGEADQVVTALPGDPGQLTVAERIATAIQWMQLNDGVELGLTPRDALRAIFAVLAGKSAAALGNVRFRNFGDTKNRVSVTFDRAGSRLVVTYDFS